MSPGCGLSAEIIRYVRVLVNHLSPNLKKSILDVRNSGTSLMKKVFLV